MSCTSPLTVAMMILPLLVEPVRSFSASIYGSKCATASFITRADLTTCGKNILPAPNKSPTTFMPAISGPSITASGGLPSPISVARHSSVSATTNSVMPRTMACSSRLSTGASRQDKSTTCSLAWPLTLPANSTSASPAPGFLLSTTSSTFSRNTGSSSSYTPNCPALTMPMVRPALTAWYKNTVWIASRTASLPRKENDTLETPPDVRACGRWALIQATALMKSTA